MSTTKNWKENERTKGEVDAKEVALAVTLGQSIKSPIRAKVKANAKGKVNQANKQA